MQNYKDVCGNEKEIWFEIKSKAVPGKENLGLFKPNEEEIKEFLEWAKSLGCIWLDKREINPEKDYKKFASFFYSVSSSGTIGRIPCFAWCSKTGQFDHIKRYMFCEYIKGNFVSPSEYHKMHKLNL